MELTISIVLHNSIDGLDACLDSIGADCGGGWAEVVAVDNASPDESAAVFRSRFPTATVVASERNLGFAGGVNLAWPYVDGRYWLLLNPDTVVPQGLLCRMVEWLDDHPRVGVASPHLMGPDGRPVGTARRFPSIGLSALELTRLHLLLARQLRGRLFLGPYLRGLREVAADWVPGTAMFLRRSAVQEVGLLNETFFMYGEDVDYCWRARQHGWGVRVPSELVVQHLGRVSAARSWGFGEASRQSLRGWYLACARIHGRRYARRLLLLDWCGVLVEARLPWRSKADREAARSTARLYDGLWAQLHRGPTLVSP
jgi:GT2 family glycosyltransferase